MAFNFLSKKIVVTGAGRGLGRELAIKLADSGAEVFAVSKTASTLETLKNIRPTITTIPLDLSEWNETRKVLGQLDAMDGLVNNAALLPQKLSVALETEYQDLQEYSQNNLYSAINCIQTLGGKMVSSGKPGSIVNVSSICGSGAFRGTFPYNVSKAAMDMVTKQFALELGEYNIRVNSVSPDLFLSDSMKALLAASGAHTNKITERIPMKRLPEVSEVVDPILYLLSDHSSMVNGTIHFIDGGKIFSLSA